jgi:hypothetical protein
MGTHVQSVGSSHGKNPDAQEENKQPIEEGTENAPLHHVKEMLTKRLLPQQWIVGAIFQIL